MTLAVADAESKIVDVVAFADVDIEESVKGGLVTAYSLQYFFCQNLLGSVVTLAMFPQLMVPGFCLQADKH